jgi:tRNA threonylcarbamoyl adenosine modification protein YeaZ
MDTSTAYCSAAFGDRCEGVEAPTGHAEHLAALIREVAPDVAKIESIVVGVGPGPYTGLRVGVVTALTMAEALAVPVSGVCSLDGIGRRIGDGVVVTDARRREVFAARYSDGRRVEGPVVIAPAQVPVRWSGLAVVGPAVSRYPELGELDRVEAAGLVGLPEQLPVRPWYLREPDARPL